MTDPLNLSYRFPGDNDLDIPMLAHTPLARVPGWLLPYRQRTEDPALVREAGLHFFLSDYRFEAVWNRPQQTLTALRPYRALLTPDFSLYRDWPLVAQMWNVYRSRWCGAYWQAQGLTVIPSISWSTAASYDFCFLGLPRRSVVAVATVGLRDEEARLLFLAGFREMVRRLSPSLVLCYGRIPSQCHDLAEVLCYPTRWQSIRQGRAWAARRQGTVSGEPHR
ncbi:MAG: DUF4417 domain-containing protein [Chloroflexota bacterium]